MTTTHTKKTPVAELGGTRDEGLKSTPMKELNDPMISRKCTPAQYVAGKTTTIRSTRISIDGGHIDIDQVGSDHIELSARASDRLLVGLLLDAEECTRLGEVLVKAGAPEREPISIPVSELLVGTIDDVVTWCEANDVSISDAVSAAGEYREHLRAASL